MYIFLNYRHIILSIIMQLENQKMNQIIVDDAKITDTLDELTCVCSDYPSPDDISSKIRGDVYHNEKLIFKSTPYPIDFDGLTSDIDLKKYRITTMREGTIIRVFYYNDKWYITTHKKLNAYKSSWGNESFGNLFERNVELKTKTTLTNFLESLNKNYLYVFLVGTNENTKIVSPSYNDIFLINCMDKKFKNICYKKLKSWYPETLNFESMVEITNYVNNLSFPFENGYGVFLTSKTHNIKIVNNTYKKYEKLRHNLPSIDYAYLFNVFDNENKNLFRKIYKNRVDNFNLYDNYINKIVCKLYVLYRERYIYKQYVMVDKEEDVILYNVHGKYIKTRIPINLDDIYETVSQTKPVYLNKMIKKLKSESES